LRADPEDQSAGVATGALRHRGELDNDSIPVGLEERYWIRDLRGLRDGDHRARAARRPGASLRTLVVETRIVAVRRREGAPAAAVRPEYADADDAVGAEAGDRILLRTAARARVRDLRGAAARLLVGGV